MPQPNDLSRSLVALDQDSTIIAVVEMSQSSWLVAGMLPGIERHPRKKLEPSAERLLGLLHRWRDEAVKAGRKITRIALAFEAGRDGFWLARWLRARGVETHVIHASSVAVSREHRRAKTDRLDTELLKRGFLGWLRGERGHCTMARVPTIAEEDAKRPNRERECLVGERTRIVNRMKGTLARLGIRTFKPTLRKAAERLATLHTPEGSALPPNVSAELQRDIARLGFVISQIKEIEEARQERLEQEPETGPHAIVRHLARVVGVGIETADMLVNEVLSRPMRGPQSSGALRWPDGLAGRERREAARTRARQSRQRPGPPWHDPTRLALSAVSEGERTGPVVPGPHCRQPSRHAQDDDLSRWHASCSSRSGALSPLANHWRASSYVQCPERAYRNEHTTQHHFGARWLSAPLPN